MSTLKYHWHFSLFSAKQHYFALRSGKDHGLGLIQQKSAERYRTTRLLTFNPNRERSITFAKVLLLLSANHRRQSGSNRWTLSQSCTLHTHRPLCCPFYDYRNVAASHPFRTECYQVASHFQSGSEAFNDSMTTKKENKLTIICCDHISAA